MNDNKPIRSTFRVIPTVALSLVTLWWGAGCASNETGAGPKSYDDPFFPAEYARLHDRATAPAVASAARADATFYDMHFHGGQLNLLGEHKLAALLADDDQTSPVVIYIDSGSRNDADEYARQESIRAFAAAHAWEGFDPNAIRFERGHNPGSRTLAAPLQKAYPKTESGAAATGEGASISN